MDYYLDDRTLWHGANSIDSGWPDFI